MTIIFTCVPMQKLEHRVYFLHLKKSDKSIKDEVNNISGYKQ